MSQHVYSVQHDDGEGSKVVVGHFDRKALAFTIAATEHGKPEGGGEWQGRIDPDFYADLAARRLVYTNPPDHEPGGSLLRVLKYAARGYHIAPECLAQIVANLAQAPFEDVVKILREVDPILPDILQQLV